ncbi:MAG: hypothetical protein D6719_08495 [Candidatus Dadabacteria bacterium]|nr:MAG: hypothetical protein D6719_08495 [Candidatus Dadabacteria bacterium]
MYNGRGSKGRNSSGRSSRRGGRNRGGRRNDNRKGKGGRSNYRGGGRRDRNRDLRRSSESGNKRERIAVESGYLVLIDQFMLANPQFYDRMVKLLDEEPEKKDELVKDYGGTVVSLTPGTYRIARDPFAFTIVVHPDGESPEVESISEQATEPCGRVFIDTRCVAMIDRELLDDHTLFEKYQQLWFNGQDKACRDLLRDNGGAVRYGFQRYGDELGIFKVADENVIALWPDVVEPEIAVDQSADQEQVPA